jgi:hypothetical protein
MVKNRVYIPTDNGKEEKLRVASESTNEASGKETNP